jgi:hypothetical protein
VCGGGCMVMLEEVELSREDMVGRLDGIFQRP